METVNNWLGDAGTVTARRVLKNRTRYADFFLPAKGEIITVDKDADIPQTLALIKTIVKNTLPETERFARYILRPTLGQTCEAIWGWIYTHIRYEKDQTGKEQVRSPARLFSDGYGDCDCFTTFIDSVLTNVQKLTRWKFLVINRITKYGGNGFQHIYPVVKTISGEQIILDCVTEYFDYEEPYTEKEDHLIMELQHLNGVDQYDFKNSYWYNEEEGQNGIHGIAAENEDLGKLKLFNRKEKQKDEPKEKGGAIKKVVHAVNRANPATVLLRNGLLASMKLNVLNVAGRLKWTYLTPEQARQKGLNMERWEKAKTVRDKLEAIFYSAGGMKENLREAILTGKGNESKEVSGLIFSGFGDLTTAQLREVLGEDLFTRENPTALSGLGEPITAAALTAASAAIATLNELLKKIGAIRNGDANSENANAVSESITPEENTNQRTPGNAGAKEPEPEPVKFTDSPIEWVKQNPGTTVLGLTAIALLAWGGYKYLSKQKQQKAVNGMNGIDSPAQVTPIQFLPLAA